MDGWGGLGGITRRDLIFTQREITVGRQSIPRIDRQWGWLHDACWVHVDADLCWQWRWQGQIHFPLSLNDTEQKGSPSSPAHWAPVVAEHKALPKARHSITHPGGDGFNVDVHVDRHIYGDFLTELGCDSRLDQKGEERSTRPTPHPISNQGRQATIVNLRRGNRNKERELLRKSSDRMTCLITRWGDTCLTPS